MSKKGIFAISAVALAAIVVFGAGAALHHKKSNEPLPELPIVEETTSSVGEDEILRYEVPETPIFETLETSAPVKENIYSDTTICAVFGESIRNLCVEVFGEYISPLQRPYELLEEAGYKYVIPFETDTDTFVIGDNQLDFSIYLPGARGRFIIKKEKKNYVSTFYIPKDEEFISEKMKPDGDDGMPENIVNDYKYKHSDNPIEIKGYTLINSRLDDDSYYLSDWDQISDGFPSAVVSWAQDRFGSSYVLADIYSVIRGTVDLENARVSTVVDGAVEAGNYLFVLTGTGDDIRTDMYVKE